MRTALMAVVFVALLLGSIAFFLLSNKNNSGQEILVEQDDTESESFVTSADRSQIESKQDLIRVASLQAGDSIESPVVISGEARGYWFFEASFPVVLVNRSGQIIARGVAQAGADWMTEEFVPFTTSLTFKSPYMSGDPVFMSYGAILFQKDNPSGEPENADQLRIPVLFAPNIEKIPFSISIPSPVTIYDGITVMDNKEIVDLSNQGLSGSLKAEIRMLTQLQELSISNNNFTGLPAEVGQLSELRRLNLSNNPITGLPHELGNLVKLEVLDLRGTQYSEVDLEIIKASLPSSVEIVTDESESEVDKEDVGDGE